MATRLARWTLGLGLVTAGAALAWSPRNPALPGALEPASEAAAVVLDGSWMSTCVEPALEVFAKLED
jgi:hypothetical protein